MDMSEDDPTFLHELFEFSHDPREVYRSDTRHAQERSAEVQCRHPSVARPTQHVEVHVLPVQLVVDQHHPLQVGQVPSHAILLDGEGRARHVRLPAVRALGAVPLENQRLQVGQGRVTAIKNGKSHSEIGSITSLPSGDLTLEY